MTGKASQEEDSEAWCHLLWTMVIWTNTGKPKLC